ncbi:hypothetical protein FEA48_30685 [Pseudomonas nitroreducens]|uniref:Uncharacterized protein n=1 Tax=Pseudomonas nitroreducens TaxID=46680 RepID=A0A5R8ZQ09_PSENT|nr:hypothetical protein [Pseudomonas nitroreducens]TLP68222.1 hypothetical protein FEA48_30685 [Pseudomonas nitroreducens]
MKKSSTQIVLEAVRDLHVLEQIVTRETLAEVTGLKPGIIDDRLKALVDDMLVLRVERGVFVPAPELPPARPVTKTLIPGGWVKIEIGDDHILTLTPAENRALGELMAGAGQQYASIEMGHQNAILAAELAAKVRRLEKQVGALTAERQAPATPQLALVLGSA